MKYDKELKSLEKVREEVRIFKLEYPDFNDEVVSDYMELLTDYNSEEKQLFLELLGY